MSSVLKTRPLERLELTPVLGRAWVLKPRHLAITVWFGAFFLYLNYIPLYHTDIWGHVAYGNWMLDQRTLPDEDPFLKLAEGVPLVNTAWLGQVVFAAAQRIGGAEWISHVFALCMLASYLVLFRVFFLQTRRCGIAAVCTFLVWIVGWSRHAIVRPEVFGSLCFALLLWLVAGIDQTRTRHSGRTPLTKRGGKWLSLIGVPVLFCCWANLHGSFPVGIALLGCCWLGRIAEVFWRSRKTTAVFNDDSFRHWFILLELAVAALLLNPYGMDLLLQVVMFPSHPNLKDVLEWFPLEMVSYEGIEIGFSWILLITLLRHSRRRVAVSDALLLAVFTLAVCLRVRMVAWYAPVLLYVLAPHVADVAERLREYFNWNSAASDSEPESLTAGSFRYTLLCGLVVWLSFALAPVGRTVLGGQPRPAEHVYSHNTPRGITKFLREHPPRGQIANPQWWGDWLVWDGPPNLQVLMTTNALHLAPHRLWEDYLAMARGETGLQAKLDRYRVNTIVVDKDLQRRLARTVRRLAEWEVVYEDELGFVAVRRSVRQAAPATYKP